MTLWLGFVSRLRFLKPLIYVSLNPPFSGSSYYFKEENISPLAQMTKKSSSNLKKREKGMGKCVNLTKECLFGIQAQINIWTGMVSSRVWWKIGPFQAALFGWLACWLYHLGITGLSDVFPRGSPRACAHPYPSAETAGPGAWAAPRASPGPAASPGPNRPCSDAFLGPPLQLPHPVFETLSIKCHFSRLYLVTSLEVRILPSLTWTTLKTT